MIHVDRTRVPRPDALSDEPGSPWALERAEAEEFFTKTSEKARGQRRFMFRVYHRREVREALSELFHGKCAYCETRTAATGPLDVELFRPKGSVSERPDHPGYWWLAGVWENFLAACVDCNRSRVINGSRSGKANRFPLEDESERAFSPGKEMRERPLLLDPCSDFPEDHLVFDEHGLVSSETPRGQTTIAVLGLNRPGLVSARRAAALQIAARLRALTTIVRQAADPEFRKELERLTRELGAMTEASEEYAALKRQLIKPALEKLFGQQELQKVTAKWGAAVPTITPSQRKHAQASFKAFEQSQSDFSLAEEEGRQKFRSQRRQIESISIRNFRGIAHLQLDMKSAGGRTGWLMLLGENGTGKSSVLHAVALTLAGADYLVMLTSKRQLVFGEWVRFGTRKAHIAVKLSGFVGPHELTITSTRATYRKPSGDQAIVQLTRGKARLKANKARDAETQSVVLGYGATRLLPHTKTARYGIEYSRIDNLFDPFLPLFDAPKWLMGLEWRAFNRVAIVLKDLLALDPDAELIREKGRVLVKAHGAKTPIRQLSDGYQAVVAMSVDILEVAMRLWPRLEDAEGIVLLDEIGSHLHPTWKMRIVNSLQRAFPGMQFIATTHEPLCLRGLGEGEAVVMRRDESARIEAVTGLPSPSDFRVDQLLTSEFFGLNTTVDAEVEKIFDEYYALMALPQRSHEQEVRLLVLGEELKERRYLGDTLREQLMYEAVDQLVATQRFTERKPLPQLKREAVEQIARIWNEPSNATGIP